ncbi:MAG: hypothetical protein ABI134_35250 [Byssovorax sp.]
MSAAFARCNDGIKWLLATHGKRHLAALTGQDASALYAAIHVLHLYGRSDAHGGRAAITALRALVDAMQPECRRFVREVIPYALDYGYVEQLWPLISGATATTEQLESSLKLLTLAIAEEPDEDRKAELSMLRYGHGSGLALWAVREMVADLRGRALPGGELEMKARVWLARPENGGAA